MNLLRPILQFKVQLILLVGCYLMFCKLYQRRQFLYFYEDWREDEVKRGIDILQNNNNKKSPSLNLSESETEHYFLLVLILSNSLKTREVSRRSWNNEQYHKSRDLSMKIVYIVGADQLNNTVETDLIRTNVSEGKENLVWKVKEGLKLALQLYSFTYVLKTDIDVFHNYTRWVERLRESVRESAQESGPGEHVLYGGCSCGRHVNVEFPYCAGMGYVLHRTAAARVAEYPAEKMERAEDRNVGKVMWEWGVKRSLAGGGMIQLKLGDCKEGLFGGRLALHAGYYLRSAETLKECWDRMGLGCTGVYENVSRKHGLRGRHRKQEGRKSEEKRGEKKGEKRGEKKGEKRGKRGEKS
ncbi:hypothetical protein ACHWQZ_G019630 [Mnemiopsis leidyi]